MPQKALTPLLLQLVMSEILPRGKFQNLKCHIPESVLPNLKHHPKSGFPDQRCPSLKMGFKILNLHKSWFENLK